MEPWDLLLPSTFSSSDLLPPPSYSSQLLLLTLGSQMTNQFIHEEISMLFCSAEKFYGGGGDSLYLARENLVSESASHFSSPVFYNFVIFERL